MRRLFALSVATAVLASCSRSKPTPHAESVDAGPDAPSSAVAVAPSASAPAPAAEKPAPTLHLVAKGYNSVHVGLVEGSTVLYAEYPPAFASGDGDAVHLDSSLRAGFPEYNSARGLVSVNGRWPEKLWITLLGWPGRGAWSIMQYRRKNGTWESTGDHGSQRNEYNDEAVPWSDGRWISHKGYTWEGGNGICWFDFVVVEGSTPAVMPEDRAGKRLLNYDDANACSGLRPIMGGLRALPTGEIFLIGTARAGGAGTVERWKAGQKTGTLDTLPGGGIIVPTSIHVSAANDVLVGGRIEKGGKRFPYLAHFDGTTWTVEDVPGDISIVSVAGTSEGDTWIAAATFDFEFGNPRVEPRFSEHPGEVYHRPKGGVFQRVAFPAGTSPKVQPSRIVSHGGQIWVETAMDSKAIEKDGDPNAFLFRTRPLETVVDFTTTFTKGNKLLPGNLRPATADCDKVFVVLYTLAQDAPPDYDFPATRKALAGHSEFKDARFVETDDGQNRYFGAFVKDFDMGNVLADVIRKSLPKSRPQVLCGEPPRTRRTLNLDLTTGALKK